MSLSSEYSGIVLNQNGIGSIYDWRSMGAGWVYQTFALPSDYARGSEIPDLAGFQVLVEMDAGYAAATTINYTVEYYPNDHLQWVAVTSGTVIGAAADPISWFDLIFDQSVPLSTSMLGSLWRFGIQSLTTSGMTLGGSVVTNSDGTYVVDSQGFNVTLRDGVPYPITLNGFSAFLLSDKSTVTYSYQNGVNGLYYVTPTPLLQTAAGQGQVYQADGKTPLLGSGTTASLNFRVLALTADSGIDFLNNEYRSAVVQAAATNTSTTSLTTGSTAGRSYFMSAPQPSPFAVVSIYSDVRPVNTLPTYGAVNLIGNPSFEYDNPGSAPQWWSAFVNGGTVVTQAVRSALLPSGNANYAPWTGEGFQSLYLDYTFSAASQQLGIQSPLMAINPSDGGLPATLAFSLIYDILTASGCSLYISALFYDSTQTLLPSPYGTESFDPGGVGASSFSATTTVPANAAYVRFIVSAISTASGSFTAYIDGIQVTETATVLPYFDGDSANSQWTAQRGQSSSVQVLSSGPQDNFVVVDGVTIDPITPNMAMNVYYSQDDSYTSVNMSEDDWEQKLWTRIPQVYLVTQNQTYAFPAPVHAKYMKLEFTNLPAQSYDPGQFQKATPYKKFPTWVANFFISMMELPSFAAGTVAVQYDALSFAYQYYLDDLHQAPLMPEAPPNSAVSQLTDYFTTPPSASLDATTMGQISLNMHPFQQPLANQANTDALGSYVSTLIANSPNNFVASENSYLSMPPITTVSTLNRESVLIEQGLPVMYFYLTCRHTYKELTSTFEFNRAYFCGVNSIAFQRNNYTVASDTPLYIETGGDLTNTAFTDWTLGSDNNWYVYVD